MLVAIVGPGALGATVGALLVAGGRTEVVLCARTSFERVCLSTPSGTIETLPRIVTRPEHVESVDFVCVATKTYDVESTAPWLRALRRDETPVAVLQNGVEHRERFRAHVPASSLVPVVVDCPAERSAPGRVRLRGPAHLTVANGELGLRFAALFEGSDVLVTNTTSFEIAAWRKLTVNAAGAARAMREHHSELRGTSLDAIALALARETIAVGHAECGLVDECLANEVAASIAGMPADRITSLEADLLRMGPNEVDARNGAVVRFGARHGVPTPFNALAVRCLARPAGSDQR